MDGKKKKPLLLRLWWVWLLAAILILSEVGTSRAEQEAELTSPEVQEEIQE